MILFFFPDYIVLPSSDFSVTGIHNVYLLVIDWIFSLTFFVWSFEVGHSFVEFVYAYCLIHQSAFVFRGRSAFQIFFFFFFFVFVNFSDFSNVRVSFVLRHVQFFVFFNFVIVLQMLARYLNLRLYLIIFVFIGCVFILWYFVVQFFCIC